MRLVPFTAFNPFSQQVFTIYINPDYVRAVRVIMDTVCIQLVDGLEYQVGEDIETVLADLRGVSHAVEAGKV